MGHAAIMASELGIGMIIINVTWEWLVVTLFKYRDGPL